jgi:hypothetical protein
LEEGEVQVQRRLASARVSGALFLLLGTLTAIAILGAASPAAAAAADCPNQERRAEQGPMGLALPDCRAYELVSPGSLTTHDRSVQVSRDGNALAYYSFHPVEGATTSSYFSLATRGPGGWAVRAAGPQNVSAAYWQDECDQNLYFSPDFSLNIDEEGWLEYGDPRRCKRNEAVLVPGEPNPSRNVFLHDVAADSFRLVNLTPEGATPANAKFQDASDDFSRIFFSEEAALTDDAPAGGRNFYVWEDGVLRLLTVLPDGTPASGELVEAAGYWQLLGGTIAGSGMAPVTGAVSADGARAFFYAGGRLYLRQNPSRPQSPLSAGACTDAQLACTLQIDATQGPGAGGGGIFWRAGPDASKVIFTAESRLTADSTADAGKPDLYRYDVATGDLTDLTVSAGPPADVLGVTGASEDLSRVYFVANGVLAPGASPGSCEGFSETEQTCNLYLSEGGSIEFLATLSNQDGGVWQDGFEPLHKSQQLLAQTSPGGRYLAFTSVRGLTGYDNHDAEFPESRNRQIYLYDAGTGNLACVSCGPSQSRDSSLTVNFSGNFASSTPGGAPQWRTNSVLADGSVFFDSEDSLVPADLDQTRDVYRYREGQLHLFSGGDYPGPSRFRNASPDGDDVFFSTPQSLLATDTDRDNISIYDARVRGGFPLPAPPAPACEGDGCRPLPALPPEAAAPGSASFQPSAKPKKRCKAKRRARCKKRHRHGRHSRRAAARGEGRNR